MLLLLLWMISIERQHEAFQTFVCFNALTADAQLPDCTLFRWYLSLLVVVGYCRCSVHCRTLTIFSRFIVRQIVAWLSVCLSECSTLCSGALLHCACAGSASHTHTVLKMNWNEWRRQSVSFFSLFSPLFTLGDHHKHTLTQYVSLLFSSLFFFLYSIIVICFCNLIMHSSSSTFISSSAQWAFEAQRRQIGRLEVRDALNSHSLTLLWVSLSPGRRRRRRSLLNLRGRNTCFDF